ncbi:MAG TPA: hypothetical protein VFO47_01630, partial [Actinomycetes bacterium]|nr:hypothetical protein [Actinomycetes bacterium]
MTTGLGHFTVHRKARERHGRDGDARPLPRAGREAAVTARLLVTGARVLTPGGEWPRGWIAV